MTRFDNNSVSNIVILPLFLSKYKDFYNRNKNKESAELFLPAVINNLIQNHKHIIKLVSTNSLWFGLTYSTDLVPSQEKLKSLIDNGEYPSKFNV